MKGKEEEGNLNDLVECCFVNRIKIGMNFIYD